MNKKYYAIAMLLCLILLISACKGGKSGTASGTAPRTPFIGGVGGITINFEKDSPPPEVTDDETFGFRAIVRLKNEGEYTVPLDHVKINLIGFDPADFGNSFEDLKDGIPQDTLESKKRDAEGSLIEGATTYVEFPKSGGDFVPTRFPGNTPFTFRADVCYHYQTEALTKLCMLRDMINVRDDAICRPTFSNPVYSSSAPVQVTNFRQNVIGRDKLSFSFDVVLTGNVDIFWSKDERIPSTFDDGCPRNPRTRREVENNVGIEITEVPNDPIVTNFNCGGLDGDAIGVVRLVNGRRTITCTADLIQDRLDLEKNVGILLKYNVLDNKETEILVKHLSDAFD